MSDQLGQMQAWMQQSLLSSMGKEEEVMLEISVPISADLDVFRIGWSLKGVRSRRWITISTGQAVWSTYECRTSAQHIESILATALELVQGPPPERNRA